MLDWFEWRKVGQRGRHVRSRLVIGRKLGVKQGCPTFGVSGPHWKKTCVEPRISQKKKITKKISCFK